MNHLDFDFKILYKRNLKNINLRIKKDGSVQISAPPNVTQQYIVDFLIKNIDWVKKKRQKYITAESRPQSINIVGQEIIFDAGVG